MMSCFFAQSIEMTPALKISRPKIALIGRPMLRSIGERSMTPTLASAIFNPPIVERQSGDHFGVGDTAGALCLDLEAFGQGRSIAHNRD